MHSPNIYSNKSFYNLIFIDLSVIDKEVTAMFDTGAGMSIIPESLAFELGFKFNGSVKGKNNQGNALNMKQTIIPRLTIGACKITNLECLILEDALFNLQSEDGKDFPAEMILGWNAIKDFYWECNSPKKTMYVALGGQLSETKSLDYEGFPLINARFNNKKLKAGLDIGHTSTMISAKVQGIDYEDEVETEIVGIGTTSTVKVSTVAEFNVFIDRQPVVLKNLEVYPEIYGGEDLDVLFGADLLEGFRWIIDYKSKCFKMEEVSV